MRAGLLSFVVAVVIILIGSNLARADIPNPGSPTYANRVMSDFIMPVIRPGETARISFNVSNPYNEASAVMVNATLSVGIYWYATTETDEPVTDAFPNPPSINGNGTEETVSLGRLDLNSTKRVNLAVETAKRTPHGSFFSQSTYFIRFKMSFNFELNSTTVLLQSRGYFTEAQWSELVSFDAGQPIVDTAYLKSLGVDGLLPDSSFGIKVPIPRWPLGLLIAACVALCLGALYSFVMDNPGKYPRLEKRFYYLRGKLGESWRQLKHRRGK